MVMIIISTKVWYIWDEKIVLRALSVGSESNMTTSMTKRRLAIMLERYVENPCVKFKAVKIKTRRDSQMVSFNIDTELLDLSDRPEEMNRLLEDMEDFSDRWALVVIRSSYCVEY